MSRNSMSWALKLILSLIIFITAFQFLAYIKTTSLEASRPQRLARSVYASELLARIPARTGGVIPKIFHQSWKTLELPNKFQEWSRSCRQKHKDWEWVLWTDDDNLQLVKQHFPWLEEMYTSLPGPIYRADLSRFLYMYIFGGVYADLDTECLLPSEDLELSYGPLFKPSNTHMPDRAIFGRMGTRPDFSDSIPNAWMAASPGHPVFMKLVHHIMELVNNTINDQDDKKPSAELVTGPVALREGLVKYEEEKILKGPSLSEEPKQFTSNGPFAHDQAEDHQVLLLPGHLVYPYSWAYGGEDFRDDCWLLRQSFDADTCKAKLKVQQTGSICITYWSHTHMGSGHSEANMKNIEK
ncbi:hypothetical protein E4U55_000600 [Claviceps digitariae]|nr:hypothetical protein E4U55_000600 [Claviceps digitariae]